MATQSPMDKLIKMQYELEIMRKDFICGYQEMLNRLNQEYQKKICHILQQKALHSSKINQSFLQQYNKLNDKLLLIQSQISLLKYLKNQSKDIDDQHAMNRHVVDTIKAKEYPNININNNNKNNNNEEDDD